MVTINSPVNHTMWPQIASISYSISEVDFLFRLQFHITFKHARIFLGICGIKSLWDLLFWPGRGQCYEESY